MRFQKYFDKKRKKWCWRYDLTLGNQRLRRGGFDTRDAAERVVNQLRVKHDAARYGLITPPDNHTLEDLLNARLADPQALRQRQAITGLRWFVAFTGARTLIRQITRAHIVQFRVHLETERPRKAATLQQYCNYVGWALRAATNYFPELEWTPPRIPQLRVDPGRDRVLRAEELRALWRALDADRRKFEAPKGVDHRRVTGDLMRFALLVPARRGELLALTPEDVNLDWMTIRIYSPKVNTRRALPLSAAALAILRRNWPAEKGTPFFRINPQQLIRNLQKASADTGIVYGRTVPGGWSFHDLRHTAASAMSAAAIDHTTIAYLLGHDLQGRMTHRYIHPSLETQRRAVEALQAFLQNIDDGIMTGQEQHQPTHSNIWKKQ